MKDKNETQSGWTRGGNGYGLSEREPLIFSHVPATRIVSAFFMVCGLFVGVLPQFAQNRDELGAVTLLGLFLAGAVMFGAAACFGNFLKRRDVFFSVTDQALKLREKTWITQKSTLTTYPITDIARFDISSERDSEGDSVHVLTMAMKNGHKIPLSNRVGVRSHLQERKEILDDAVFGSGTKLPSLLAKQREEQRVPKLIVATILVVCIIPIVAMTAGNLSHSQSSTTLNSTATTTTSSTAISVEPIAQSSLKKGEHLIWYGQPELGREASAKMPFFLPFSVVWTLFSLAFTGLALSGARQGGGVAGYGMALFGVPFVLIGFGLLVLPFFASETEMNTVFVITDQRAFSYANGKPYREVSYLDADFGPVEITSYKADRGDVLFIKNSDEGRRHPYTGFYGVLNPSEVASLLEKQAATASSRQE